MDEFVVCVEFDDVFVVIGVIICEVICEDSSFYVMYCFVDEVFEEDCIE